MVSLYSPFSEHNRAQPDKVLGILENGIQSKGSTWLELFINFMNCIAFVESLPTAPEIYHSVPPATPPFPAVIHIWLRNYMAESFAASSSEFAAARAACEVLVASSLAFSSAATAASSASAACRSARCFLAVAAASVREVCSSNATYVLF